MRQLFSKGVHPPILDILRHIFLNPNIEEILPQTGILLELTIQSHPPEIKGTLNITINIDTKFYTKYTLPHMKCLNQ